MGALPGLVGLGGGAAGTSFQGPVAANTTAPTNAAQLGTAYSGTQNSMQSQQALLAALQAQGGLNNQNQVYGQLQGVANGTGPNPAKAQLAQATGANVANQAALMAGQRGAGANVGLTARQAAQQGAATEQQAAGQAATLQAQQSLNALGAAGSLATQQAGQEIGQTNTNTQAQQQEQANLLNAMQGYNTNQVAMQSNINAANAGLANTQMQGSQNIIGGLMNAGGLASGGAGMAAAARGGMVKKMADGGTITAPTIQGPSSAFGQFVVQGSQVSPGATTAAGPGMMEFSPNTSAAAFQGKKPSNPNPQGGNVTMQNGTVAGPSNNYGAAPLSMPTMGASETSSPAPSLGADTGAARGGEVKALVAPGEKYLDPKAVQKVKRGANPMKVGETIPGKPKVGGAKNSYDNDTVPKKLKVGGIVVPRSETQSKNPERASADFVNDVMANRRPRGKK